jgi:hypothetical protein
MAALAAISGRALLALRGAEITYAIAYGGECWVIYSQRMEVTSMVSGDIPNIHTSDSYGRLLRDGWKFG